MAEKRWVASVRKRVNPAPHWGVYLTMGVLLLAVSGAAAQLLAAPPSPNSVATTSTASQAANVAGASSAAGASSSTRTLYVYGDQLRPLVEETGGVQTLNIYGPGGQIIAQVVQDGQGGQEVRYLLADHLGSTRVVLDADGNVVARFEYGPHGETTAVGTAAAEVRYRYTGHPWDEAQGVYETPARGYDPTLGRFLSVDAARQSTSPYIYTGNNPVNKVDPNGLGPVYFFLFSEHGGTRPDVLLMKSVAAELGYPIILSTSLENPEKISIPQSDHLQHVTIKAHGSPGKVFILDQQTGRPRGMNGEEFAEFLYDRLQASSEGASEHLKSIHFSTCGLACRTERPTGASNLSGSSFPEDFVRAAKTLFPELEHATATPYNMGSMPDRDHPSQMVLDVYPSGGPHDDESLRMRVPSQAFFEGDFLTKLLDPPSRAGVDSRRIREPLQSAVAGTVKYLRSTDSSRISDFISSHDFTEPIFRQFPVIRPEMPPAD